jgi:hypothetical protein
VTSNFQIHVDQDKHKIVREMARDIAPHGLFEHFRGYTIKA